jgi:hypothetical protein
MPSREEMPKQELFKKLMKGEKTVVHHLMATRCVGL